MLLYEGLDEGGGGGGSGIHLSLKCLPIIHLIKMFCIFIIKNPLSIGILLSQLRLIIQILYPSGWSQTTY